MAVLHQSTITPSKLEALAPWMPDQRWFVGKARAPQLSVAGSYRFDDPLGEVGIEILIMRDDSGAAPVIYQVPVTYRAQPLENGDDHLITTLEHSVLGTRYMYDGPFDPVFAECLLRAILTGGTEAGLELHQADGTVSTKEPSARVQGSGTGDVPMPDLTRFRVLGSEQSNTSIVLDTQDADGAQHLVIIKIFRVLHDGDNPDVELQSALTQGGSDRVPAVLGYLRGSWPTGDDGQAHSGHLAVAQEFLPGVQDAWCVALAACAADQDFSGPARALGVATAEVHRQLGAALPTRSAGTEDIDRIVGEMSQRFRTASTDVDDLGKHAAAHDELMQRARTATWPALQRIHGDYHLGQVLDVPGRGWVLLDFEGEPLRPLSERVEPDVPLRDVAGMLRSFDYAAASVAQSDGVDRSQWARSAREAFLDGYAAASGMNLAEHQALLDAFEVDKASYEVSYEVANRPDWVPIPVGAINRLLGNRPGASDSDRAADQGDSDSMSEPVPFDQQAAIGFLAGRHADPHTFLGGNADRHGAYARVFRPMAKSVQFKLPDGSRVDAGHEAEGLWSARLGKHVPDYRVITTYDDGVEHVEDDPYRFLPSLGALDIHLINEGRHEQLWTVLGARLHTYPGPMGDVHGTAFAVWAPNALAVRVASDFNHWNSQGHPMRRLGGSGLWELFVPDIGEGTRYKFEILCADHQWRQKADPLARLAETAPATASIVTASHYEWGDDEWMTQRAVTDPHDKPMSIYEVHLGSWRQGHSYRDLAEHLTNYVKDLGYTHVEFLPVMEHPYPPSWGYHVTGYYAPNSRMGSPDDFRFLVDTLHNNGIGVLLDWVPGHFATDEWALARFDGTPLYEHPDPNMGWQKDWGSYVFNFGRPQVRNFLVANALYWMEEFHADGLRVDGVASMLYRDYSRGPGEWTPNIHGGRENLEAVQLLQETTATSYRRCPGTVMIAEESTSWPGVTKPTSADGLGFGFKWNMGWMHDSLDYVANDPIYRSYHHGEITFALVYAWSEQYVLPISHDEVVHGKGSLLRKMPGDRWQQLANLRAFLGYMWSHPGKQLLFMGCEFAQESEWADGRSLDWWLLDQPAHWGVHALVKDLNRIYKEHAALWELDNSPDGFHWIDADDAARNTLSYIRYGRDEEHPLIAVVNFSGSEHVGVRIGLPFAGTWREVLNTDARDYGGSGEGNLGAVEAEELPCDGQPASGTLTIPALSTLWFVRD